MDHEFVIPTVRALTISTAEFRCLSQSSRRALRLLTSPERNLFLDATVTVTPTLILSQERYDFRLNCHSGHSKLLMSKLMADPMKPENALAEPPSSIVDFSVRQVTQRI